ncbi:hypothetical protein THRCLA_21452 [Thraustotheca clavata]|uniref:Uncharacterized protein n=1 Tax=Thraustotheca clavata TaxID=74557 RepID=A0A1V9ZWY4_9STRA|nr:hypothetical protein THRCLA_21452 [Thraustotheca clavata]
MSGNSPRSDLLCKYTYKPCINKRTTKKNGELHMLCSYHRDRANAVQRTHAMKRKLIKALDKATESLSTSTSPLRSKLTTDAKTTELTMNIFKLEHLDLLLGQDDAHHEYTIPTLTEDEYNMLFELF